MNLNTMFKSHDHFFFLAFQTMGKEVGSKQKINSQEGKVRSSKVKVNDDYLDLLDQARNYLRGLV